MAKRQKMFPVSPCEIRVLKALRAYREACARLLDVECSSTSGCVAVRRKIEVARRRRCTAYEVLQDEIQLTILPLMS